MPGRSIPQGAPIRVVGDVHGDATAFSYAAATDRFVVQLGDLTDYGPDNAGALRIMFRMIDEGRGLFLLGNHDLKLARFLAMTEAGLSFGFGTPLGWQSSHLTLWTSWWLFGSLKVVSIFSTSMPQFERRG